MRQADRAFSWADPTADIVRRIRAADGTPGVRTSGRGGGLGLRRPSRPAVPGRPAPSLQRRRGAVLVRTGDGSVWMGHAKLRDRDQPKLPATWRWATCSATCPRSPIRPGYREISYCRTGPVGVLTFDFYNGAMSTGQCSGWPPHSGTPPPRTPGCWSCGAAKRSPTASTST